jgi:hypothetical protein
VKRGNIKVKREENQVWNCKGTHFNGKGFSNSVSEKIFLAKIGLGDSF